MGRTGIGKAVRREEALRHATLHRGGRADQTFLDRVKDDPELGSLPFGS